MSTIKRLNELSEELYGEFGFATLNEAQMDLVLQYYIDLDNTEKLLTKHKQGVIRISGKHKQGIIC